MIKADFQMVRENILLLNEVSRLDSGLGVRAGLELTSELRLLTKLREQYFGFLMPIRLSKRVIEEAKAINLETWNPPSLEEKRRWFSSISFHEEYFTPCRVMWIKVIIRAAYDYALWKESGDLRQKKHAYAAAKWLFDDSDDLLNSFKSICFLCKLPMEDLMSWAKNLTREQVKKFEFLERNGKDFMTAALQKRASSG